MHAYDKYKAKIYLNLASVSSITLHSHSHVAHKYLSTTSLASVTVTLASGKQTLFPELEVFNRSEIWK